MSLLNDFPKVKVLPSSFNSWDNYVQNRDNPAAASPSNVRFPLEYYGEELDKVGVRPLVRGQFFDLEAKPLGQLYDLVQSLDTLDVGEFQLELIPPDFRDNKGEDEATGRMAVYLRSRRLGEILVKPVRATFRTDRNDPPRMDLVNQFLQTLRGWMAVELTKDALKHLMAPEAQESIGIEGVKALINLDKLNLKFTDGNLPNIVWEDRLARVGAYLLELQHTGGLGYEQKAIVRYRGRQIGVILWAATWPGLEGTARFEVDNGELYGSLLAGSLRTIIAGLADTLDAQIIAVFRVDIAIDSPGVMTFLNRVHSREIMMTRQSSYHKGKKIVGLATDQIEGFGAGSRSSGRYFRVYDKIKQLKDERQKRGRNYKQHIDGEYFPKNGLDVSAGVGRLEVELLNRFLKTVEGFTWEDVFDREKMVGLFSTAMDKVFEWVPTEHSDSKINRRPRVQIVDFSAVSTDPYERSYPVPCKSDRMEKITIKRMAVEAAFVDTVEESVNLYRAAEDMVDRHQLHNWFRMSEDRVREAVGNLIVERNELPIAGWDDRFLNLVMYCEHFANKAESMEIEALRNAFSIGTKTIAA